jgi:hypothetical protein
VHSLYGFSRGPLIISTAVVYDALSQQIFVALSKPIFSLPYRFLTHFKIDI